MDGLFKIIITIIVTFVIFLVLRELNCWYWKINEIVTLLEDIKSRLPSTKKSEEGASCEESASDLTPAPNENITSFGSAPSSKKPVSPNMGMGKG